MKRFFNPTEIIFCPTDACNLHCPHCFVSRDAKRLSAEDAIKFLDSCSESMEDGTARTKAGTVPSIEKVGFSGGEPFLHMEFLTKVSAHAVEKGLMFDQVMTNGDWWKDLTHLKETLHTLWQSGYDGNIGLSWDGFHGQKPERMVTFIRACWELFGDGSVSIQQVLPPQEDRTDFQNETGFFCPEMMELSTTTYLPVHTLPQTFTSEDPRGWNSKNWFKDDFCTGPGNILFVHATGQIAPCCGFANENEALIIGNINQSFKEVMESASENQLVCLCYEKGLLKQMKTLERKKMAPGKTCDICTACDFISKNTGSLEL